MIKKGLINLFDSSPDIKTLRSIMTVIMVLVIAMQVVSPVLANTGDTGPFEKFTTTIKQMSGYVIQFLIFLGTAAFVIGMVKAGVAAQVGQQLGMANMVSAQILNIIMGVILFILMISIFEIAVWVINTASAGVSSDYSSFPVPGQ
jgi:hypothetical protein